jgi:hypothetical protein
MAGRANLACRWAELALLGVAVNLAVLLAAPIARPDLDLLDKSLSYYAVGPWAMLQSLGFAAMGVASFAIGIALLQLCERSGWLRLSVTMLGIAGIASIGLVAFPLGVPTPHTAIGDLHQTSGTIGGVAQLIAALAFAMFARADAAWARLYRPAVLTFVLSLTGAVLSQIAIWRPDLGIPMGATMRLVVIPLVLLWGLVALQLRRDC